jgi:alcohol dehydrogenase class IV
MKRFEFATATRIVFGEGTLAEVAPAAAALGRRALVVTGASMERAEPLLAALGLAGVSAVPFPVPGEPTVELVSRGTEFARAEKCDVVISIGGGSPIDAGKALAAMLGNPGEPLDYLEVVGRGKPLLQVSAPYIAVPTTAGTGSEVTRNAVLGSPQHRVKASLRSAGMLARLAVVDPELTLGLPRPVTASTGLDALTQLIEPYVSSRANPMTDGFCVEGIRRIATALPCVWENGADRQARADMSWASLLGGLSLANAGLGAVHGFAAPIGGMFPAPHGAVCAAVLPHAMAVNVEALRRRAPELAALRRYQQIACIVTGRPQAAIEDGLEWVAALCRRLEIPSLGTYGVGARDIPGLVEKAAQASSMKANPIALNSDEMKQILERAI